MNRYDEQCMRRALELAQYAYDANEVPIGAIVVDENGSIIGQGYNRVESEKVQTAHAELNAITAAARTLGDWRLDGCTLYVTLEPCSMCMGLIRLSRVSRVVYALESPRFGYQLDNGGSSWVYKKDVYVEKGIGAAESQQILRTFFQQKRKKKDECTKT